MFLNLRAQYSAGTTPRQTADAVITALTPAAWYRNATGVTSAGGFASQWDDYSGNTRHLVQATGTNQPAYAAGVFTFDGADNYMKAVFSFTQPETVFIVVKQISWTNSDPIFDGNLASVGTLYQTTSTPQIGAYAGSASTRSSDLLVGSYGIVCVVFNGASSVLRVNNNADITGNFGSSPMNAFTLGARGDANLFSNVAVQEVVLYSGAIADSDRSAVITALNNALTVF